ncbi:SDR family oxidoreductase [Vitiosangium sp. GDMCC 1.1324]|uniref:SDR family oxidoreductase n=1 Tax=Vitiosangium sp. (strain GDMCC 1.1324) TaxID=2138576 RepID=UPI000D35ED8B|nr:NAD(P)H-binding protein [Vitiosangium sp. GDMCC 1.1324]PTL76065.1 capsule biosynthesis protein CapD [Vitiosangium sp. GDMCC 1.1324]
MIVVTGATGSVGSALLKQLKEAGVAARAVTRDAKRAAVPVGVEVAEGDLTKPESLENAFSGASALFLLMTAGDVANRVDLAAVVGLARRAGVKRVVLVSSLLAQTHPDSFPGRSSLQGEQIVRDSGLAWTLLRPWEFASNVLAWAPAIRAEGIVRVLTSGLPSPAIHPADIASVAFRVLTEDGHEGAIYPLTGPQGLTPQDKVRAIGAAMGREPSFVEQDDPRALEQLARQAPDEVSAKLMIPGVCGLESPGPLSTVELLTGVPARTFQQWAHDNVNAFR